MKTCDMPTDFRITKVKRDHTQGAQESHMHPFFEIFYLINGDCLFFLDHNIYRLNKGDLVIVPPGIMHKSTYPEKGFSERYVISFRENHFDMINDIIGDDVIKQIYEPSVISIPDKRKEYVESIMTKLIFENDGQDILSPAFIKTGLIELILFILRCSRFEHNIFKEIDVDNKLIQEIATYIYNNYYKKITLDEMSEKYNISRSYLSKKFKMLTGFGFKEYIINIRIKNACRLLLETDKSITDIAFECGFNDSNYFGDAFKSIKGSSPNKYRRNRETI